jgi:integrase
MVDLQGVHRVKAKGKTYVYAWRGGPRLKATEGTPAFVEELAVAHETRKQGDKSKISGLCAMFRASDEWKAFAPKTRAEWSRWVDRIQIHFGELSLRSFSRTTAIRPLIRKWRAGYASTPRSADMGVQVLSRMMKFAVDSDLLDTNPCLDLGKLYEGDRAAIIWTATDLAEMERIASPAVFRAAKLASLTGLRKSDLLRLQWGHVKANSIEIATGKSSGRKTTLIPLYDELRDYLATIPKSKSAIASTVILLNTEGQPWKTGFGASWGRAKLKAKLENLHFHDLRGTAATRFYIGGLTMREIAGILAWSEKQVEKLIETYVLKDAILIDRIRRMNEAGTEAVTLDVKPPS